MFQGKLVKRFGGVKLMFMLEGLSILVAVLHLIKSFGLLLVLRVLTGVAGGISLGVIPPLLHDFFSAEKASLGGILCYIVVMVFITLAALMNNIFGGVQGLADNY